MSLTVTDGTTTEYVLDYEMTESINELDSVEILTTGIFVDNAALSVLDGSTTLFSGFQKNAETNDNNNQLYNIIIREKAAEMQLVILTSGTSISFNKTDTTDNLIDWVCTQVNTAYGYSGFDAWSRDTGCTDSTSLTVGCYYTNALAFLKKVVIENLGLKLWFDSSSKKVYFGKYKTDRSASALNYLTKKEIHDSNKRGCNKVIVVGANNSITGSYGTGTLTRVFSYPEATTSSECTNLATQLYAELSVANVQYELKILTTTACDPGDKINIDGTITAYVVKVVNGVDTATVTTGTATQSLVDSLGSRITEISGETVTGSDASWSGGSQNVASNATAYTTWDLNIKDKDIISEFYIDASISDYVSSSTTDTSTGYLSTPSTVESSDTDDTTGTLAAGTYYYPDSTGLDLTNSGTEYLNGYQFGFITINLFLVTAGNIDETVITPQYKNAGSTTWHSLEDVSLYLDYTSGANNVFPFSISNIFGGNSTQENSSNRPYVRFKVVVGSGDASQLRIYRWQLIAKRVGRHLHTVATTYDVNTSAGTPPTTITVKVNSGSDTTLTPGTPIDITSLLINGKNKIYVKTPSGSSNQCSVNITGTYKTLGTS